MAELQNDYLTKLNVSEFQPACTCVNCCRLFWTSDWSIAVKRSSQCWRRSWFQTDLWKLPLYLDSDTDKLNDSLLLHTLLIVFV